MRRVDTELRDKSLADWHSSVGQPYPAAGMKLPMIEYDRGRPVALINYVDRADGLPIGADVAHAYDGFRRLFDEKRRSLPFFTVGYDKRDWSYNMFPHNSSAWTFLGHRGFHPMTEREFVDQLYALRGRMTPDLSSFGVTFSDAPWTQQSMTALDAVDEAWPGQAMSVRRRNFEPVEQTRMSWRNPCLDIDLTVTGRGGSVSMIVDYKRDGGRVNLKSTNMAALSSLWTREARYDQPVTQVPVFVVKYQHDEAGWSFEVHPLNKTSRLYLALILGSVSDSVDATSQLAVTVAGVEWISMNAALWFEVLRTSRKL